jgi:hypothetical protein
MLVAKPEGSRLFRRFKRRWCDDRRASKGGGEGEGGLPAAASQIEIKIQIL